MKILASIRVVVAEKSPCTDLDYFADFRVYLDDTAHTKDFRYGRSTIPMISVLAFLHRNCTRKKINQQKTSFKIPDGCKYPILFSKGWLYRKKNISLFRKTGKKSITTDFTNYPKNRNSKYLKFIFYSSLGWQYLHIKN